MVSISYHIVLKMMKFLIALYQNLNIHRMTNAQYIQLSNYWVTIHSILSCCYTNLETSLYYST